MGSFNHLVMHPFFIDKSPALKSVLEGSPTKFLFTRPRGWGKISFMKMSREFLSMQINQTTGEEIELFGFGDFKDLKVVIEDRINIDDVAFLFRNYAEVDNKTNEEVDEIFEYFKNKQYPWFLNSLHGFSTQEKLERIHRLKRNTRAAFSSFDEKILAELSAKQIEELTEELRINHRKSLKYYQLLSTFGATCRHFKKYPTIYIEFSEVWALYVNPESAYKIILETEIKKTISTAFQNHQYHRQFLRSKIMEDNSGKAKEDLDTFQSYLLSQASPDQSLNFLSQQLYSRYKIPTVVLLNEYDNPMNTAYLLGEECQNQVKTCMSSFFACLQNEETILYTFLTGINRFTMAEISPGLNNLLELSILDSLHADSFGFTASEDQNQSDDIILQILPNKSTMRA